MARESVPRAGRARGPARTAKRTRPAPPATGGGSILAQLAPLARIAEIELDRILPPSRRAPPSIHGAMRYAVFGPGKRIRPILVLESARVFGVDPRRAAPAAAAVELVHTYSLVHDDLPCMDDDDYRRGRLTVHKKYDEPLAVLAGDSLLTLAFETLARRAGRMRLAPGRALALIGELSAAAGSLGLIGGQVDDLAAEGRAIGIGELASVHRRKTGALLTACLRMGAMVGDATARELARVTEFGRLFGQVFQITDDILDVVGTFADLGKPVGSDDKNRKATYVSLLSVDRARAIVDRLCRQARKVLATLPGRDVSRLAALLEYLPTRTR